MVPCTVRPFGQQDASTGARQGVDWAQGRRGVCMTRHCEDSSDGSGPVWGQMGRWGQGSSCAVFLTPANPLSRMLVAGSGHEG